MKALPVAVSTIVAVSIIAGFFLIGSPLTERVRRFDERRVNDLQVIQWEIINYWQKKGVLPASLSILRDDIRGFVPPQDPETSAQYEYSIERPTSFSLCATFAMSVVAATDGMTRPVLVKGIESGNWAHGSGRTCFSRTIDKNLYPPASQAERGRPVPMKIVPVIQ